MQPDLDDFIAQLNDCFGPPFLEEGLVQAKRDAHGRGFCLRIGKRDIQFDSKLKFIGRGMDVSG